MRAVCFLLLAAVVGCATQGAAGAGNASSPTMASRAAGEKAPRRMLPRYVRFADHRAYALAEPYKYEFSDKAVIVVPAGFVTDFASIPGIVRFIFTKDRHDTPALVHDFLYWNQSCTRAQADSLFLAALEQAGLPLFKRRGMYLAVRSPVGRLAWEANSKERAQGLPRIIPGEYMQIPEMTWQEYRAELRSRQVALDSTITPAPSYCTLGRETG